VTRWMSLLLCAMTLAACEPMHRAEHHLTLPAEGRTCAVRCSDNQGACESRMDGVAEDAFSECEFRAQVDYSQCQLPEDHVGVCQHANCQIQPDYNSCKTAFRSCVQSCGKAVEAK
jgi:hypothetical protein